MRRRRTQLRLMPRGALEEPYKGRRPCALCGYRSSSRRRVFYRCSPWGQRDRVFEAGVVVCSWHAVEAREAIKRETPRTWWPGPEEFFRRLEAIRRPGEAELDTVGRWGATLEERPMSEETPAAPVARAVCTPDAEDYAKLVRCIERLTGRRLRDLDPEQLPRVINL